MNKQIISLVIRDEIMEHLDRWARQQGISRSQAASEILERHFNLASPQTKIDHVIDRIETRIREAGQWQQLVKTRGSSIQCRTSVSYKYNPNIRFLLEMSGKDRERMASLKIVARSQNLMFLGHLKRFFALMERIEAYDSEGFRRHSIRRGGFEQDGARFQRDFHYDWMHERLEAEAIAAFLAEYLLMLREAMGAYFELPQLEEDLLLKRLYLVYRKHID